MDSDSVRLATKAECIDVLSRDGVIERIDCEAGEIKNGHGYLINDRMLLVLIDHWPVAEAHIAEPKEHWRHIHTDIYDSLIFIQSLGYNSVYTNVSEKLKTTLNLLKKHNFKYQKTIDNEVILKWVSKQH